MPKAILLGLTVIPLVLVGASLAVPSGSRLSPSRLPFGRVWLSIPAGLAAALVMLLQGNILAVQTWAWALPAASILFVLDASASLQSGVEQARRMNTLLYNVPGA